MKDVQPLFEVDAESWTRFVTKPVGDLSGALELWRDAGLTVRVLRGRKMSTWQGMIDECAAALQFPSYFGENWAAFQECISDMEWLQPGRGYVLVIMEPSMVLRDEPPSQLRILVRSLDDAASTYAQPIHLGEWWDRPAVPFHVVLQAHDAQTELIGWRDAGAKMVPL